MHVLDSRWCGVRSTAEADLDYIVEFGGRIRVIGCRTGRTMGSRHMTQLAELHQSSDETSLQPHVASAIYAAGPATPKRFVPEKYLGAH